MIVVAGEFGKKQTYHMLDVFIRIMKLDLKEVPCRGTTAHFIVDTFEYPYFIILDLLSGELSMADSFHYLIERERVFVLKLRCNEETCDAQNMQVIF